jgi:hypothetical protein
MKCEEDPLFSLDTKRHAFGCVFEKKRRAPWDSTYFVILHDETTCAEFLDEVRMKSVYS